MWQLTDSEGVSMRDMDVFETKEDAEQMRAWFLKSVDDLVNLEVREI